MIKRPDLRPMNMVAWRRRIHELIQCRDQHILSLHQVGGPDPVSRHRFTAALDEALDHARMIADVHVRTKIVEALQETEFERILDLLPTWTDRLTRLLRCGAADGTLQGDVEAAAYCAGNWLYCAVGERREVLEARGVTFDAEGCPHDDHLLSLGHRFYEAVRDRQYAHAREIVSDIAHYGLRE